MLTSIFRTISFKFILILFICTCLIFLPDIVYFLQNDIYNYLLIGILVVPVLLLIPVFLFSFKLNIYYFILAFLAAFSPIALLPVLIINSQANSEMVGMVLDTNYHEAIELLGWKIFLILAFCILIFITFINLTKYLPQRISFFKGLSISAIALCAFLVLPFLRTTAMFYYPQILKNTFKTYYPFRIFNAVDYLSKELKNVNLYKQTVNKFTFGATRENTGKVQQIHVLLIGETARYDHWGINGYKRQTSPYLSNEQGLISFSNVASGGSMTVISVPLIISRADAGDYEGHKKEKSILGVFKEVGYKSYWISNQSKFGLSGNIGMHYSDGDTAIFNGWGSNESNFKGNTDSTLVPMIKQILMKEKNKDLFLLVHMIGSHWRYLLRYPKDFTAFRPVSDDNRMMMGYPPKDVMINEYDNSILYSDFIIHSIINEIKATGAASTITYVSDHGENLRDDNRNLYFHGYKPTKYTAKVPLFIWTSKEYMFQNNYKVNNLKLHKDSPISSADNLFHTLIDLGGIEMPRFDKTKAISSHLFKSNEQKVLGENGQIYFFKDIE